MSEVYYLINRPVSHNSEIVEGFVGEVSKATGLTSMLVKQKLQGTAFEVFQANTDLEKLESFKEVLDNCKIPSFIISKKQVKSAEEPIVCKSIKEVAGTLTLIDGKGEEIITLDAKSNGLMVLGAINVDRVRRKRLNKMAIAKTATFSPMEIINLIFLNGPVIDLCVSGFNQVIRINSRRFNFNSLGEDRTPSSSQNLRVIMNKLQTSLKSSMVDTGFGENSLPFLSLDYSEPGADGGKVLKDFTLYSKVVFHAVANKLFNKINLKENLSSDAPVLKSLGGAFWASPLFLSMPGLRISQNSGGSADIGDLEKHFKTDKNILPAPPVEPTSFYHGGTVGDITYYLSTHMKTLRLLGHPALVVPLVLVTLSSTGVAYLASMLEPMALASLSMGFILLFHSFVLLKRKRTIENHPTVNIGTMPMGEVEISGRAVPKYYLKAPYSLLDCVYYSYRVYSYESNSQGQSVKVLKGGGESGDVPFYLEDDTGKVVVNPKGAIIKGGVRETHDGSGFSIFSSAGFGGSGKIIEETVIPAGLKLYVMGYGQRVIVDRQASRAVFNEKLRDLKLDKNQMDRFDFDGDGRIDDREWEEAKSHVRDEILQEKLENAGQGKNIEVAEHPSSGLFYISDNHEEGILSSLSWRVPLSFISGVAGIVVGFMYLPRLIILRNLLLARLFEW